MERLDENKLGEIYGGGVGTITLIIGGVVSLIIFISGVITGYTNPGRCNNGTTEIIFARWKDT